MTIDNSTVTINTAGSYGIRSYNNSVSCPGSSLEANITNSTIDFTTSVSNTSTSTMAISFDGTNTTISGNTINATASAAVHDIRGIYLNISNTDAFSAPTTQNNITVTASDEGTYYTYGIYNTKTTITGAITNNTITGQRLPIRLRNK